MQSYVRSWNNALVPSAEGIQRVYELSVSAWSSHDLDALMALFSVDAVLYDPVDAPPRKGVQSIREFFGLGIDAMRSCILAGPVHVSADCRHAAASIRSELVLGDEILVAETIDVMTFDDDGRIATMTAYWGPTNMVTAKS